MGKTEASSPNDRRRCPSHFAVRNSAVVKSWLFLSTGQLDESCLHVFYRLDAAEAEMVHGKIRRDSGPFYRTLKTLVLFPAGEDFWKSPSRARRTRSLTGCPSRASAC